MAESTEVQRQNPEQAAAPSGGIADAPRHPLDPLYASELEEVVQILARERYLGDHVRIASINLIEPAKALVEAHRQGAPFERKALAVLLDRGKRASY
jgi:primary-amine oxidase